MQNNGNRSVGINILRSTLSFISELAKRKILSVCFMRLCFRYNLSEFCSHYFTIIKEHIFNMENKFMRKLRKKLEKNFLLNC